MKGSMAWAKNQSNETQGRNFPNDWSELYAPLQSFEEKQDSLKEDKASLKKKEMMKCRIDRGALMEKRKRKEAE